MKIERTWYAADKTGFHMLHALFQCSQQFDPITRYDEWFVSNLIVEAGRCQGVLAIELRTGEVQAIGAKSVIICTGGAGKVFPFTTNASIKNGDGMALAYRAGVPLKDMEFVQYHPTGLPGTGILITEASRGEGGILLNKEGRRYLQDHDLGTPLDVNDPDHPVKRSMELGPRDRLSQAFIKEQEAGRVFEHPDGNYVHLDIRHLGEAKINKKLPFVRELSRKYARVDPVYEPIPVRPVVHYVMGGVDTDIEAATTLPGLYAAGEAACVSINGANRLGSNSLTELLVFGARAGLNAAKFAAGASAPSTELLQKAAAAERARIHERYYAKGERTETIAGLRTELQLAMESGAGIYRTGDSLKDSCAKIEELQARAARLNVVDASKTFNTQIINAMELEYMLDVAEAIAHSALTRTESRGSHQRTDFPERNDEKYLKHSLAYRTAGTPRIDYKDVVITRWPPGERVYGKR